MDNIRVFSSNSEETPAILVIDDDLQVLKFVSRLLANIGYPTVYQAASPREALDLWKEHRPEISLIVSDFVMPEITGDHLALRLLSDKPQVKVLFISGNDPESLDSAIPLRCGQNFLQKPFTVSEIKKTLDGMSFSY